MCWEAARDSYSLGEGKPGTEGDQRTGSALTDQRRVTQYLNMVGRAGEKEIRTREGCKHA